MRAGLVATAANSVTATNHVGPAHAGLGTHARNAKAAGSSFGVALDEIMKAASGDDDAGANAVAAGAAAPAIDTKSDPAKPAKDSAGDPSTDDPDASTCQPIPGTNDTTTPVADPENRMAAKDAGKPSDSTKTDKDAARHRDGEFATAHLDGTPQADAPVASNTVPVPPASTQAPAQQNMATASAAAVAAVDDQADAPATDIAAAAMQAAGATAKPGKAGESKPAPAPDSAKSQARSSAASALADVSKAASRIFADQKTASSPASTHLDGAKPQGGNGTPATQPPPTQTNPNTGQPAQSQQPQQAAVQPAPPHTQTPQQPQAPVGNAIAAASAAQQASAPASGTTTQLSAQLQIAHPSATSTADTASLAFTIASKSQDGIKHFDIRLDPAELGRIDVHLTVDDAGKAQAALSVDKPQTLELLQKDQGHLERALKESGLDLSQNGLSFSLKGQQQQAGNGGGNANSSSRGRALAARAIAAVDSAASTVSLGQMSSSDTRLDIRV